MRECICDWLCDGKRHYGEGLHKWAAEVTRLTEGTLRNFASMADGFELSRQRDKLSVLHHQEVASIKRIGVADNGTLALSDS
jgi:hypothetical protein